MNQKSEVLWGVEVDGEIVFESAEILDCIEKRDEIGKGNVTDTVK